jgi:SPW repeat
LLHHGSSDIQAVSKSWNAVIGGGVIILLSVAALAALAVLEDAPQALNAVAGGWVFVSPWALKFQGTTALSVNVAIGTIVVLLAGIELWSMFPIEPQADELLQDMVDAGLVTLLPAEPAPAGVANRKDLAQ